MPNAIDLTGQRFGRLTVVKLSEKYRSKARTWECLCDCGTTCFVITGNLRSGSTQSCGCFKHEVCVAWGHKYGDSSRLPDMTTHGMSYSRVYKIWIGMVQRCTNPKHAKYYMYGARGITVCERWTKFENFFSDMGEPPDDKHSIGRIDNERGYAPDNCRWETARQQQSNMRTNVFHEYKGEKLTVQELSRRSGVHHNTIYYRLQRGWTVEETVETPALRKGYKHIVTP